MKRYFLLKKKAEECKHLNDKTKSNVFRAQDTNFSYFSSIILFALQLIKQKESTDISRFTCQ